MSQPFIRKTVGFVAVLFFLSGRPAYNQQVFDALVDSSEYLTDILTETGRQLKFLAASDRLVILDYENYRILFYQKGTNFEDNQILNIVGQHSRTQDDQPFDPISYNRLSREFAGTIFNDTLWVANYTFGEILLFDLDGNYLDALPGSYRILDVDDSTLYAFNAQGIYRFDPAGKKFTYLKELPESVAVDHELNAQGRNVKIGFNRLGIKQGDSLHVYNFTDYLENASASRLFSKTGEHLVDFEIMPDKILWATDYDGPYQYCDPDGNDVGTGSFGLYTKGFYFTGDILYYVGSWGLKMYDGNLVELAFSPKESYYLSLMFLGADSTNLYFRDQRDGGVAVSPLIKDEGRFFYSPDQEISHKGWPRKFRISGNYKYLLSEWPRDSFKIYKFDTDEMSGSSFDVGYANSFDVVGDSIFTISGKNLAVYSGDGVFLAAHSLSNLSESNLQNMDSTSKVYFAANARNIFVGYREKLNILSHTGVFEKMYSLPMSGASQLFASDAHVVCNGPVNSLEIATGDVAPFGAETTPYKGFVFGDLYWYKAGEKKYAYATRTIVDIADKAPEAPGQFRLFRNYPNPFNPTTNIRFALPRACRVKVEVFNLLGERVATLLQAGRPAGEHVVRFDGSRFGAGVYFYAVTTEDFYSVKKMLLVK